MNFLLQHFDIIFLSCPDAKYLSVSEKPNFICSLIIFQVKVKFYKQDWSFNNKINNARSQWLSSSYLCNELLCILDFLSSACEINFILFWKQENIGGQWENLILHAMHKFQQVTLSVIWNGSRYPDG